MSKKSVAIVAAYNEAATIADVLRPLIASPLVAEVIVVSDGSTDETVTIAKQQGARVIDLPKNGGKGAAMLAGVAATDAAVLLFVDADLRGFDATHIEGLLRPVLEGARVMNVGMRDRGAWLHPIVSHLPLISGERAMKRAVIEGIHPRFLQDFKVESALNYHCRQSGLAYGTVFMRGVRIRRKWEKVGLARSVIQYLRTIFEVSFAMTTVRLAALFGRFPS